MHRLGAGQAQLAPSGSGLREVLAGRPACDEQHGSLRCHVQDPSKWGCPISHQLPDVRGDLLMGAAAANLSPL
eukprot:1596446-Lingulodinium_polyedra.AAC.1